MAKRRIFFALKRTHQDETLINLTPLIDVVFVVLVAFILIAPLLEVDNVDLAQATESSKNDISSKSKIIIHVREDNSIWINNRVVSDSELLPLLRQSKKEHPGFIPQLFHDQKATFGTYQKVKGAIEKAGFETMDVILKGH
jgi:biopolymer transport protein ExbD